MAVKPPEAVVHVSMRRLPGTVETALIRNGANVEAVRILAGHSKLDITQRYVHANTADLTVPIAKLPGN